LCRSCFCSLVWFNFGHEVVTGWADWDRSESLFPQSLRDIRLAVATAVVVATWLQFALLGPSGGALGSWIAYLVATYSVGAHAATWRAVVGLVVSTVPAAALAVVRLRAGADASEIVQSVVVLIAVWVAGRISARRHHRAELVEHRAAQVESGASDIAREAAERERTRIARELHDVVTHNMVGDGGPGAGRPDLGRL
jgi:signal transduction histidine kinase